MAVYVILGVLAAFGALCVLYLIFGLLLPRPEGGLLVYRADRCDEELLLRRYFWLRDLGLVRCPLLLVGSRLPTAQQENIMEKCRGVRFCTWEHWIEEKENIG